MFISIREIEKDDRDENQRLEAILKNEDEDKRGIMKFVNWLKN